MTGLCFAQAPVQWPLGTSMPAEVDSTWLENFHLGTVRLGSCSATFVTSTGLLLTSYECAHRLVRPAWRVEHVPLDDGFYAHDLFYERRVPGLVADHLVRVRTAQADAPADSTWESEEGVMVAEVKALRDSTLFLAYTYRRYDDIRVVMMPEQALATFGGPQDVATYPRYSLSFGFLRAYDHEGHPVVTESYLPLSGEPLMPGEILYSIGRDRQGPQFSAGSATGFDYNGTRAPPSTTLFGIFDLHFSHGPDTPWRLPDLWISARSAMDLTAQLNIAASTPCVPAGASLVNKDLEVMAVAFDYTTDSKAGHCIGTAAGAIYESLRSRYEAVSLVTELEEEGLDEYMQ